MSDDDATPTTEEEIEAEADVSSHEQIIETASEEHESDPFDLLERILEEQRPRDRAVSVWLAQCLCPSRHAILAASCEAETEAEATREAHKPLTEAIALALSLGVINPWCSLCHAKAETWTIELGRTQFATMAEAKPAFEQNEREQAAVRAIFGDMKRSD